MPDPCDRAYAEPIVEGCPGVRAGRQALVGVNPRARPAGSRTELDGVAVQKDGARLVS